MLGVGVPIFFFSHSARINALSLNKRIAATELQDGNNMLAMQYQQALTVYKQQLKAVAYYETTALKNAAVLIETAGMQFAAGEINYMEYTLLLNQAININSGYYDAMMKLNEAAYELNYLTKN